MAAAMSSDEQFLYALLEAARAVRLELLVVGMVRLEWARCSALCATVPAYGR